MEGKELDLIDLPVEGHNKIEEVYTFNRSNINYFRGYSDSDKSGQTILKTMLYMRGSEKGILVLCSREVLASKINEEKVSMAGLDESQREVIRGIAEAYREENRKRFKLMEKKGAK